ncbi:hypothetical protein PINS_up007159 [Pythium insidiosum]|nr:hypothetical protein PINS_up007159 [Pythium insidiosum]
MFRHKRVRFHVMTEAQEDSSISAGDCGLRSAEELVAFENWFGVCIDDLPTQLRRLRPKHHTMVHKQPPSRSLSKSLPATVCTTDEFPLTVEEFLPVIEVLSKTTSAFENAHEFFHQVLTQSAVERLS